MSQLTPHPQPTCLLMSSWARRANPWKQAAAWCHQTWPEEVRTAVNTTTVTTKLHLKYTIYRAPILKGCFPNRRSTLKEYQNLRCCTSVFCILFWSMVALKILPPSVSTHLFMQLAVMNYHYQCMAETVKPEPSFLLDYVWMKLFSHLWLKSTRDSQLIVSEEGQFWWQRTVYVQCLWFN